MVLLIVALVTMIIANSPLRVWYEALWNVEITFGTSTFNFFSHGGHPMTLLGFVNDALMAIFFFSVGLEIKREMLVGELSSFRQVLLPFIAACGGMLVPVLIFFITGKIQSFSPEELRGMAIPMATDIAFSLGVLSLFSKRVPVSLKVFLLALAIVDDIGGIIVIAIFYSSLSTQSLIYLGLSLVGFTFLILGNRLRINSKGFYTIFGILIWYMFLQAGIHPTIAGVLVAFTVPARPYLNIKRYTSGLQRDVDLLKSTIRHSRADENSIMLSNLQIRYLSRVERASDRAISPLQDLEDSLGGIVNFFIMPLFAFANAGVVFDLSGGLSALSGITLSIMLGLIVGKSCGIFSFSWLAIKLKICRMPAGMNWKNLFGMSLLGGIGFTVALFLATLSYPKGTDFLNQAKLGILLGSFISGVLGYLFLNKVLPKSGKEVK
ncbi:Na+/H+ antiporter NhaA [Paludibacter sp. 221]|uniref:Na+/H+ antiporter NhaA n=1 Tax=Paludibacter sp. 221 TaxID=2302939 RepID=UPI001EF298B3|nr:Na+/H+ antiporter NhaA [Paludibacter sp. 221]